MRLLLFLAVGTTEVVTSMINQGVYIFRNHSMFIHHTTHKEHSFLVVIATTPAFLAGGVKSIVNNSGVTLPNLPSVPGQSVNIQWKHR